MIGKKPHPPSRSIELYRKQSFWKTIDMVIDGVPVKDIALKQGMSRWGIYTRINSAIKTGILEVFYRPLTMTIDGVVLTSKKTYLKNEAKCLEVKEEVGFVEEQVRSGMFGMLKRNKKKEK